MCYFSQDIGQKLKDQYKSMPDEFMTSPLASKAKVINCKTCINSSYFLLYIQYNFSPDKSVADQISLGQVMFCYFLVTFLLENILILFRRNIYLVTVRSQILMFFLFFCFCFLIFLLKFELQLYKELIILFL